MRPHRNMQPLRHDAADHAFANNEARQVACVVQAALRGAGLVSFGEFGIQKYNSKGTRRCNVHRYELTY